MKSKTMAETDLDGKLVYPEKLRSDNEPRGDGSYAVAVARVVLLGYSSSQAEMALKTIGRNDSAAAIEYLKTCAA